jgi:dCTP deaminase
LHTPECVGLHFDQGFEENGGLVNVSGFHVDPGFRGRLKFSVYNAGSESIILGVGERLFPIWFYELPEENEDEYVGRHQEHHVLKT